MQDLLAHEDVDAVWVTSPNHTRVEAAEGIGHLVEGTDLAHAEFDAGPEGSER